MNNEQALHKTGNPETNKHAKDWFNLVINYYTDFNVMPVYSLLFTDLVGFKS